MAGRIIDLTLSPISLPEPSHHYLNRIVDYPLSSTDSKAEQDQKRTRHQPVAAVPFRKGGKGDIEVSSPDVEIVVQGPRSAAQAQGNNLDLGDEDLRITNETGQVALRDLPHPRPDCGTHCMARGAYTSNADFCQQCFCFVCDVKAPECRFWGTGARERDHANARPIGYWKKLRGAARGGNHGLVHAEYHGSGPLGATLMASGQLQPQPPYTSLTVQRGATHSVASGVAAATSIRNLRASGSGRFANEQQSLRSTPTSAAAAAPGPAMRQMNSSAPKLTSGECKLKRLPDPASDPSSFELGVLRFHVKATRGLTIAAISERLERFGFYYNRSAKKEDHGDRLSLSNLFETKLDVRQDVHKDKALYLKMLPLPTPPGAIAHMPIKTGPMDCIRELQQAMLRSHPEDTEQGPVSMVGLDVALEPSKRPGADPREGQLVIKVFLWTAAGPGKAVLFERWNEWRRDIVAVGRAVVFSLSTTMRLLAEATATALRDPTQAEMSPSCL